MIEGSREAGKGKMEVVERELERMRGKDFGVGSGWIGGKMVGEGRQFSIHAFWSTKRRGLCMKEGQGQVHDTAELLYSIAFTDQDVLPSPGS